MHVCIVIPTHDRAHLVGTAIEAALNQSHPHLGVLVVDDASTDETWRVLRRYEGDERFAAVRLGRNVGTARAKNVGLALGRFDAVTFHDSDDIPLPHKVLLQVRAMERPGHVASPVLDWEAVGITPGAPFEVDVVVGRHEFITGTGERHVCGRPLSLVDDLVPHLQVPGGVEGDWVLVNSGLFRRGVFEALGGYLDSVEEDREIRNRTIAAGCIYHFIDAPLLTKIETAASLTTDAETGYDGPERKRDRSEVWRRMRAAMRAGFGSPETREPVPLDLGDLQIADVIRPEALALNRSIPATPETWDALGDLALPTPSGDGVPAAPLPL